MTNLVNCLENFQIYVGTYKKYNEGSIFGEWLQLSNYSDYDELLKAMKELHKDEADPEFMIQDFECNSFFVNQNLISECFLSESIFEIAEKIENSGYDIEIFEAFTDCFGNYKNIDKILDSVSDSYMGSFDSDTDFAENLLTETGSIPQNLPSYLYIDWERTARDLMMDYSTSNNHYFRCL